MKKYYVEGLGVNLVPLMLALTIALPVRGYRVITLVCVAPLVLVIWRKWVANTVTDEHVIGQDAVDLFLTRVKVRLDEVNSTSRTYVSMLRRSVLVLKDKKGAECAITSMRALEDPRIEALLARLPPKSEERDITVDETHRR